jgi:hypothetical protein
MITEYKECICKNCGISELMSPSRFKEKRCRKCMAIYQKEWRDKNIDKARKIGNKAQRNLRRKILEHYSGLIPAQCVECGESRYQCLELDHIIIMALSMVKDYVRLKGAEHTGELILIFIGI